MKSYIIAILSALCLVSGCDHVEPKVKATVLLFDATRARCGGSWQIQMQGEQKVRRVYGYDSIPAEFRVSNINIWVKFKPDAQQAALGFAECDFIKIVSIRKR